MKNLANAITTLAKVKNKEIADLNAKIAELKVALEEERDRPPERGGLNYEVAKAEFEALQRK